MHASLILLILPTRNSAFAPSWIPILSHEPISNGNLRPNNIIIRTQRRGNAADALGVHKQVISNLDNLDLVGDDLERLGWQPHFSDQLSVDNEDEEESLTPVRITEVHSRDISIVGAGGMEELIPNIPPKQQRLDDAVTVKSEDAVAPGTVLVGDWILVNERRKIVKILERRSFLRRGAPGKGKGGKIQSMAANIDTVFVVSSCNQDFNVARLERYVAMALEANVTPVIVLTKRDRWDGVDEEESLLSFYLEQASGIVALRRIPVVLLDARGTEPTEKLREWCRAGQTVAFLGSSGVGKSTLVNSLCGCTVAKTGDIHEDSGQGRHTTTRRQLHFLPRNGCAILDTPGLRELRLAKADNGVTEVFADLVHLSRRCGFRDCKHKGEPNCAIQEAILDEEIDWERVERWQKLVEENQLNFKIMTEHERRKGKSSKLNSRTPKKKAISKAQQKKNNKYRNR